MLLFARKGLKGRSSRGTILTKNRQNERKWGSSSHVRQAKISGQSFSWVALGAVLEAIRKIEDDRASVRRFGLRS